MDVSHTCDSLVDLARGWPSDHLIARAKKVLISATQSLLNDDFFNITSFSYGRKLGHEKVIKTFSKFLSSKYKEVVPENTLMVTSGASAALGLIYLGLLSKDATVFSPDLYYPLGLGILKDDLKLTTKFVPSNAEGVDLAYLEASIQAQRSHDAANKRPPAGDKRDLFESVLYLVPTFNNPRGSSYSEDQCKGLVALAEKYRVLIICDDVYNFISYTDQQPKRLLSYESPESEGFVVSNGSFSKILAPAVRVGWIEARPSLINKMKNVSMLDSGGCVSQYASLLVSQAIRLGLLDTHIDQMVAEFKERVNLFHLLLRENLPKGCSFKEIQGGYFIWIELPKALDAKIVTKKSAHTVFCYPSDIFCSDSKFKNGIRLSIARVNNLSDIDMAVRFLCQTIGQCLQST